MELAYFIQEIAGFEKGLDGFFEESTLSVYDSGILQYQVFQGSSMRILNDFKIKGLV